jgi:hypothetical protein
MNSTNVLAKIMKMLALSKDDVELAGAQSEDGTIYESPNFEVGDEINTVSEDGTLLPAADGNVEVIIQNEDGEEEGAIITIADGKITAVSEHPEESEDNEPMDDEAESDENEGKTEQHMKRAIAKTKLNSLAGDDISSKKGPQESTGTPKPLAETNDKKTPVSMDDLMEAYSKMEAAHEALATKLDELTSAHEAHKEAMSEVTSKVHDIEEHLEDMDEEMGRIDIDKAPEVDKENIHPNQMSTPKLGGAPVNASAERFNMNKNSKGDNAQANFLAKLYN